MARKVLNEVTTIRMGESCGKNGPPLTILSFSKGLGLGCGFLVRSFHMIRKVLVTSGQFSRPVYALLLLIKSSSCVYSAPGFFEGKTTERRGIKLTHWIFRYEV